MLFTTVRCALERAVKVASSKRRREKQTESTLITRLQEKLKRPQYLTAKSKWKLFFLQRKKRKSTTKYFQKTSYSHRHTQWWRDSNVFKRHTPPLTHKLYNTNLTFSKGVWTNRILRCFSCIFCCHWRQAQAGHIRSKRNTIQILLIKPTWRDFLDLCMHFIKF